MVYRIEPDGMPEFGRGKSTLVTWEPDQTREQFQAAALAAIGAAESDETSEVIDG